jgi:hypothetical protein
VIQVIELKKLPMGGSVCPIISKIWTVGSSKQPIISKIWPMGGSVVPMGTKKYQGEGHTCPRATKIRRFRKVAFIIDWQLLPIEI